MAKAFKIEVSLKDTEQFKKVLNLLKEIINDERISDEVKLDIKNKINKIVEECQYE